VITIFILVPLTAYPISAYDPEAALGSTEEYIPNELRNVLPDALSGAESADDVMDALDFGEVTEWLCGMLIEVLRENIGPFCLIMASVVISTVFSAMKNGIASDALSNAAGYAVMLCTSLTVYGALESLWESAARQLETLTALMYGMLPVMTALYSAGGNTASAAVSHSGMLTVITLLENVLASGLFPILKLCFVFSLAGGLGGGIDLGGVSDLVRNAYTTVLCFVMTILSTVMAYQNKLASAADSIGARTVKFAAGNLIPVVGGAVGEAVRTLGGSVELIRSTVGVLGVAAVALIMLPTVISLLIGKGSLNLISVIARAMGCDGESRLISSASSMLNLTLALVAACSVFFMYALTLFIKTGAAIS